MGNLICSLACLLFWPLKKKEEGLLRSHMVDFKISGVFRDSSCLKIDNEVEWEHACGQVIGSDFRIMWISYSGGLGSDVYLVGLPRW
ncbi:hypothetical protein CUMW_081320 [Citrus unshiu]|nr:hypothetical protein CUMW_081320 [Citrus unshiu]